MNRHIRTFALLALALLPLITAACGDRTKRGAAVPDAAAPDSFRVKFETTKGEFTVAVTRAWAPKGADRFHRLVTEGYFKDVAFFRVLPGFMAQFGMSGDPELNTAMDAQRITDDPATQSNTRGTLTFATAGPDTRTNQLFINYADNAMLDAQGFAPIGKVLDGMSVVDSLYSGYGEGAPNGRGPDQDMITKRGNAYLRLSFPKLDYIRAATIVK